MFWRNAVWSWDNAVGDDNDDDGDYLLTADLRRTPDPVTDSDLKTGSMAPLSTWTTWTTWTTSTAGLKDRTSSRIASSTNTTCRSQTPMVNIARGKDGFGFTICCDCPVRVQAVDPGGPAHQSGLHQGDTVLQLNGLPVETWKCVDLAHAIRGCPSHIVLVVWRGSPELRSGCEALLRPQAHTMMTGRKLLPAPTTSKHGRRQGQASRVQSKLGALGSLWRDRKMDQEEEEEEEYYPRTTTLKGTCVTSSNGDNYIILSPVSPGEQVLQPVCHDRDGTIGHLYQTDPSRGQSLLHDPQPGLSRQPFSSHTSTLLPPPCSSSSLAGAPGNYGNYQNCTIVQSHLPCSTYGTYVTLAPKTLIFPVFVQPLDLCSPDRTLLMSEEMVLHQADLLPAKVTALIYSDLLLLTREDEAGRCNVLQSPLFLNTLQLREVPTQPLLLHFLQTSESFSRFIFSLESFSMEQKVRVRLCLHDNICQQLVTMETAQSHQLSDLASEFDPLLHPSSSPSDALRPPSPSPYFPSSPFSSLSPYPPSSPSPPHLLPLPASTSTQNCPSQRERGRLEEEEEKEGEKRWEREKREEAVVEVEERQQGEGESASETSENVGVVWGRSFLLNPHHFNMKEQGEETAKEEGGSTEGLIDRPAVLRHSVSEGSLLQEPRPLHFLSDSTIHQLTRPNTFDSDLESTQNLQPPSPNTLRKQLTKEGGSLHHMLLLLNSPKGSETRKRELMKRTKTLAADVQSQLVILQQQKNITCLRGNSLEKALIDNRPSLGEVLRWTESLEALLTSQYGLTVFYHFLRSEFSEENLDFWLAVEKFKRTHPHSKLATRAAKIYEEFISTNAVRQVNLDSTIRESTNQSLRLGVNPASFQLAQDQIFGLMETDSYPRFLCSSLYAQVASQCAQTANGLANQSADGFVPVSQS